MFGTFSSHLCSWPACSMMPKMRVVTGPLVLRIVHFIENAAGQKRVDSPEVGGGWYQLFQGWLVSGLLVDWLNGPRPHGRILMTQGNKERDFGVAG